MTEHRDETFEEASGVMLNGAAAAARAAELVIRRRQGSQQQRVQDTQHASEQLEQRYQAQIAAAERYYASQRLTRELATDSPAAAGVVWQGAHTWAQLEPAQFAAHADRINDALRERIGTDPRAAVQQAGHSVHTSEGVIAELVQQSQNDELDARGDAAANEAERDRERDAAEKDLDRAHDTTDPTTEHETREDAATHLNAAAAADDMHLVGVATAEGAEDLAADYDSPQRRSATEGTLRTAGVPEEALTARMTADRLNGQHPHTAAGAKPSAAKKSTRSRARVTRRTHDSGLER